jgi:hypothetical protein
VGRTIFLRHSATGRIHRSSLDVGYGSIIRRFAGVALRHPVLIVPLLATAWRFRRRRWYARPPFLPVPPADYVAWRLYTAYGDEEAIPPAEDLRRYLVWSARVRR